MQTFPVAVDAVRIVGAEGLDPIHVFWVNVEPGKGYVTIICYGAAWSTYFGGMSGKTIQQFFSEVEVDYLLPKLGIGTHLKSGKKYDAYLAKIIKAVRDSLKVQAGA